MNRISRHLAFKRGGVEVLGLIQPLTPVARGMVGSMGDHTFQEKNPVKARLPERGLLRMIPQTYVKLLTGIT